ncbi:hypothetical protein [Methyloversatilis discipulorum]|uniref:hypothetical protein n=1 Tax=Methyloversatilis discipulorum TaxID=1119528 RepID=UPI0003789342|nr:hypothetical protein [Methyloversatilis discipulorum]
MNIDPTRCFAHIGAAARRLERAAAPIVAALQQIDLGGDCAGSRRAHGEPLA